MGDEHDAVPTEALGDVAYLSRSANRVAILDALADGPAPRRELADTTGVSRTTLDRIVNELEDRGWAERTPDGDYVATPTGSHLLREFRPVVDAAEALRRLGDAVAWLPTDELDVRLGAFRDAEVRQPEMDDPVEAVEFMADLLRDTTEFRVLSHLTPPETLARVMHERVLAGALTTDGVVTDELVRYLGEDPTRRRRWREMLDATGGTIVRVAGPLPCNAWILDDTVLVKQSGPGPIDDSYGAPIVSRNEDVVSWAHDLIDRYQAAGTPVDPAAFAEPTVSSGDG